MSDQIADSVFEGMQYDRVEEPIDFRRIFRKVIQRAADVIRDRGGVMPEELPGVEYYRDPDGKRADAYTSGIVTVPESLWSYIERIRQQGLAYLDIAQKLKEAGA